MVVVGAGLAFLLLGGLAFQFAHPARGDGNFLVIKCFRAYNAIQVHLRVVGFDDFRAGVQMPDDLFDTIDLVLGHFRHLVEQHDIAELDLLDEQVLNVLFVNILALQVVSAGELALHPQGIDHGHDAVEARGAVFGVFRVHAWDGGDGAGDGLRFADAAGLDHDVVELSGFDEIGELIDQIHLEGAADTAVLQGHQTVVLLGHDAAFLDQRGIDVHLAYVVDYHRELDAFAVRQNMVHQRGFAASEVAGEQQYRYIFLSHIHFNFEAAKVQKFGMWLLTFDFCLDTCPLF